MILNRRVALNGAWLDEVDPRIVISAVEPSDGRENISATDTAAGFGQRVTSNRRTSLDLVIRFMMLERGRSVDGLTERSALLEKINAWAAPGGVLTVNYKPNRRLNVILVQAPGEGSLWDFSKEFSMTFRAYTIPYWEDETENTSVFGGGSTSDSASIAVGGSAATQFNVELANKSGKTINNATVTVNGNKMSFTSLGMEGGETLVIDHRSDAILRIRIRNAGGTHRNAMSKRTGANDMTAKPGAVSCSYYADRACEMKVSWRSRYV